MGKAHLDYKVGSRFFGRELFRDMPTESRQAATRIRCNDQLASRGPNLDVFYKLLDSHNEFEFYWPEKNPRFVTRTGPDPTDLAIAAKEVMDVCSRDCESPFAQT